MTHRRDILDRQITLLNRSITEAQTEVEAYQKELAKIKEQQTIRATALETLETLSKKGLTTQQRMTNSQFLLASAQTAMRKPPSPTFLAASRTSTRPSATLPY